MKDGGSESRDALINEIKHHFEEEMKVKKKLFDAEIQQDEVEEKLFMLNSESNVSQDKNMKARYDDIRTARDDVCCKLRNLRRSMDMLVENVISCKRYILLIKVVIYLMIL